MWRNAAWRSTSSSGPLELSNSQRPSSTAGFCSCLGRYCASQKFPKAVCFRSFTLAFPEASSFSVEVLQPIILFSCFKIIISKRCSLCVDELPQKLEWAQCCWCQALVTSYLLNWPCSLLIQKLQRTEDLAQPGQNTLLPYTLPCLWFTLTFT